MPIKKYKPTTNGRRGMSGSDFAEITTDQPEKSLLEPLHKKGGRNNQGRISVRHQGGGTSVNIVLSTLSVKRTEFLVV